MGGPERSPTQEAGRMDSRGSRSVKRGCQTRVSQEWNMGLPKGALLPLFLSALLFSWALSPLQGSAQQLDWDAVTWPSGTLTNAYSVAGGTVTITLRGDTDRFTAPSPVDNQNIQGGLPFPEDNLFLHVNYAASGSRIRVNIDFSHPGGVRNVAFSLFDIDLGGFTDRIRVFAFNGGSRINPSTVTTGANASFDGVRTITGLAATPSSSGAANARITFGQSGITRVSFIYTDDTGLSDPPQQWIGLHDISFQTGADLEVTKTGPASATLGDTITYTLEAVNLGPTAASDVVLSDTLPTGGNFVSASNAGDTLTSGVVTWPTVASLAANDTLTYTMTLVIGAAGTLTNVGAVESTTTDPVTSNNVSTVLTTVTVPDIVRQRAYGWSDDVANFAPYGDDLILQAQTSTTYILALQLSLTAGRANGDWYLQVREDGAGSWLNVLNLGGGQSPVWQTYSSHTYARANGSIVPTAEFGIGSVAFGFSAVDGEFSNDNNALTDGYTGTTIYTELQYAVRAEPAAAGHFYDFRVVYEGTPLDGYDRLARATLYPDLEVTKTGPASVDPGDTLQYTIQVVNLGSVQASSVVITDTLPASGGYVGASNAGDTLSTGVVTWPTVASMLPNDTLAYTVTYVAPATGPVTNLGAAVTGTTEMVTGNNSSSHILTVNGAAYGVDVSPGLTQRSHLPTNGSDQTLDITVTNSGSATDSFDLLTAAIPGTFINVVSISGAGVTQGTDPDSARVTNLAASGNVVVTVTYSAAIGPPGAVDTLAFSARSVGDGVTTDEGRLEVTLIRPDINLGKSVTPNGMQAPGTDLTYTVTVTNAGTEDAVGVLAADSVPGEIEFQVGSIVNTLPSGVTVVVEYSDDGGVTWVYSPTSGACGATAGFDQCVGRIRWRFQDPLGSTAPDNIARFDYVARIR